MTEQELKSAYEKKQPVLEAWGRFVTSEIVSGLENAMPGMRPSEFFKIPPTPRVKETASFLLKAIHRGKKYDDPLSEITDQVGVRFVVLLLPEIAVVEKVVTDHRRWRSEKARDFEEERTKHPHHFDYQSVHYILWASTPTDCGGIVVPAGTPCEVQIRTLLQHAYAELAHDLTYKPSMAVDPSVRRTVAKSMALMETTDDLFVEAHTSVEAANAELSRVCGLTNAVYRQRIRVPPVRDERICSRLLEPFRDQLKTLTPAALEHFLEENDFICEKVESQATLSLFYQLPCVLAVYWLVRNHPDTVPTCWPAELSHLRPIYTDLGISSEGRLW